MAHPGPLLATYGTLRRTLAGFDQLGLAERVRFVESCTFTGVLYDLGRYPGAVPGEGVVRGDLHALSDANVWTVLDRYEGYAPDRSEASLFVRRRVTLRHPPDQEAWIYWYNGDPSGHPRVPSGDWAAYLHKHLDP